MTPEGPRNGRRHPPRGHPAAAPTTPSQVGGNRDRTAPPQARQTEQGTGAGHAEGHGPRGTALPAPSAGTTRDAHATPPSGGGSGHRERASAHTRKGHAGTTGRATGPSTRNAQTAWNGVLTRNGLSPIRYQCFQRIASTSVVAATVATASTRSKRRNSTWIKDNLIE